MRTKVRFQNFSQVQLRRVKFRILCKNSKKEKIFLDLQLSKAPAGDSHMLHPIKTFDDLNVWFLLAGSISGFYSKLFIQISPSEALHSNLGVELAQQATDKQIPRLTINRTRDF